MKPHKEALKADGHPARVRRTFKVRPVAIAAIRVAPVHVAQRPFRAHWAGQLAKDLDLDRLGFLHLAARGDRADATILIAASRGYSAEQAI